MEGRLFLLDRGRYITVRNAEGTAVSFDTTEEFHRYYSGLLDLAGEYYIDYEPDKEVLYLSARGNFKPLNNRWNGPEAVYDNVIADVQNMKTKLEDPYFGLSLEEARERMIQNVKRSTYHTITARMPEWKQIKWKEYIAIHIKTKNNEKLTPLEKAEYESFPAPGRTHEDCYVDSVRAFGWLRECVARSNKVEADARKAGTIKKIKQIQLPDYPLWEI
jgi:hypothetical protein